MKRITIFMIVGLLLLLTACGSNSDYNFSASLSAAGQSFQSLDELIEHADHIVYGTLIKSEPFDSYLKYTVKVNQQLKGKTHRNEIAVFSAEDFNEEHKQFLLFLSSYDDEFREEIYYTSSITPTAIENEIALNGPFAKKELKKLIKDIEKSSKIKVFKAKTKDAVIDKAKDIYDLIDKSEYIVHIKPLEVRVESPIVKSVTYDVITKYKGDDNILKRSGLTLPNYIELDEEYMVFYQTIESLDTDVPTLTLATRKGSVIAKSDTIAWEEAVSVLEASQ